MGRRAILGIVALVAILSAGLGWVVGQQIKSPADVAAEAEPPEASLITVPVEQRSLSSNVVLRGQVEFNDSSDLTVTPGPDGISVITGLPKEEGDNLNEGDVAIEIGGRPVIVLEGQLPAFRSFAPGLIGPDVKQLEEALDRLGYDVGTIDNTYDTSTESAVEALYKDVGYTANVPTTDDLERLEAARSSVRSANEGVTQATQQASTGLPESTRLELDRSVANAQDQLEQAESDRETALDAAGAVRRDAVKQRRAAETAAGATGSTQADQEALTAAIAAEQAADTERLRVKNQQDSIVENATIDLRVAEASRRETVESAQNNGAAESLAQSREALADAQEELSRIDAAVGTAFPASELIFLPTLPAAVQSVPTGIGDTPQGAVMTVTGSDIKITSSVSSADRSLLEQGATALMEDDALGISAEVVVSFIADNPGGPNAGDDRFAVQFEATDDLPEEALNQNLRITVPFSSTDGDVLAVPLAALSAGADGSSRVEVERTDGSVEIVTVVPGLNARAVGLVEITPTEGELAAGDRVIVGRDNAGDAAQDPSDSDEDVSADSDT